MSESEDFAALFEASVKSRRFKTGETIEGTIVGIGPEVVFVDVGGKGEATIELSEVKDSEGDVEVSKPRLHGKAVGGCHGSGYWSAVNGSEAQGIDEDRHAGDGCCMERAQRAVERIEVDLHVGAE